MLTLALNFANELFNSVDENLSQYKPTTIITLTLAATFCLQKAYGVYKNFNKKEFSNSTIKLLMKLPYIGPKINNEINKEVSGLLSNIKKDTDDVRADFESIAKLPDEPLSEKQIQQRFSKLHKHYQPGKLSGAVYARYSKPFGKFLKNIWSQTALTNPMHSEWPLINLMEAEIISMCQNLLHGESGAPGMMTHGGSTSIFEACKSYVLAARKRGIERPEIIVPDTIHIAFDKAAETLNCRLTKIPVNSESGAADAKAMAKAITKNTCLLVGSAPSFPNGVLDPIAELGAIAIKNKIPLHVDACLGGFLTVFAEEAGFKLPICDFRVPGVTSISIDTHKYGQTPKGTSVLLYSSQTKVLPTHVHLDWVGGMYVTPGIDGSRSGADIATAWTVLCRKGKRAYIEDTRSILTLKDKLIAEIKELPDIFIPYEPQLSVITLQSKNLNSLLIADVLQRQEWAVNIIQTPNQQAAGFHFCLTSVHAQQPKFIETFMTDLTIAIDYAKANPQEKPKGMAKAYGKLEKGVPGFVQEQIGQGYIKILNTLPEVPMSGLSLRP